MANEQFPKKIFFQIYLSEISLYYLISIHLGEKQKKFEKVNKLTMMYI